MQPMQHPVIVLPGTDFTDLCALVTFMYSGEVNIYQHQLTSLLAMADTLHIRGLAEFTGVCNTFIVIVWLIVLIQKFQLQNIICCFINGDGLVISCIWWQNDNILFITVILYQ